MELMCLHRGISYVLKIYWNTPEVISHSNYCIISSDLLGTQIKVNCFEHDCILNYL
jgi:hypothetical protein